MKDWILRYRTITGKPYGMAARLAGKHVWDRCPSSPPIMGPLKTGVALCSGLIPQDPPIYAALVRLVLTLA